MQQALAAASMRHMLDINSIYISIFVPSNTSGASYKHLI